MRRPNSYIFKFFPTDDDWGKPSNPEPIEVDWSCEVCEKEECECKAIDKAWELLKDFYYGSTNPNKSAGFSTRHDPKGIKRLHEGGKGVERNKGYVAAANISHPIFQYKDWHEDEPSEKLSEEESIKEIISTLVHEEGHEAIRDPLEAEAHEDFYNSDDIYATYPLFAPSKGTHEYGALMIEALHGLDNGQIHTDIMAELQRRGFFG